MFQGRRKNLKWVDINMAALELDKLILHFAQSNKAEGKSPKTIAWYTEMLNDFVRFLKKNNEKTILADYDVETVREFIVHEQGREISPYTVQGKVRALKAFASWLFSEGYTSDNLFAHSNCRRYP